jgi:hypothetical protein
LLFQTGYLTVKQVRTTTSGQVQYILGYPNHEVAQAFQQYLLADYLAQPVDRLTSTLIFPLDEILRAAYEGLARVYYLENEPARLSHAELRALNLGEMAGLPQSWCAPTP